MSIPAGAPVGVVGAGTMGAGIAEVAARAGHPVRLLDAAPGAGDRAVDGLRARLRRDVEKGRFDEAGADAVLALVATVSDVAELAGCAVVVEAVAERLDVKRQLFADLEPVLSEDAVIATNTSSLSVTALAAPFTHPERVLGLHFFNPAPRMRLVEIVHGEDTSADIAAAATELMRAWGKTPVQCTSTPGFIVNRVARPFYGEAQRMVEEDLADPATIDLVLRECGGFPMGPFELTDMVGQDVNLAVSRSVWDQTFHDPRYAPTVFQQQLVDAGRLGRKSGRGVFDYRPGADGARPALPAEPPQPAPAGVRMWADYDLGVMGAFWDRVTRAVTVVVDDQDDDRPGVMLPGDGLLRVADGGRAAFWADSAPGGVVFLDWAHDPATCRRVTLSTNHGCTQEVRDAAVGLCQAAGVEVTVVRDGPGAIVARTVAMLVNEAVELVARGEATAEDVDVAMLLGTGYPSGPLQWGDRLHPWRVESVLSELAEHFPSGRYRPSLVLGDVGYVDGKLRDL